MNECYFGECRDVLRQMIANGVRVSCVITSPPYWGLRSYLDDGHEDKHMELGSEPTLAEFVANLVEVFSLVREILTDDGVLFMNLGDSYAVNGSPVGQSNNEISNGKVVPGFRSSRYLNQPMQKTAGFGLKPKDLCGVPWRVAFALQEAGWWLRQDIIWAKPNPMPESVTDRCTKSHEYVFLLTKSARYFFDAEAIAEPVSETAGAQAWRRIFDPAKQRKESDLKEQGVKGGNDGARDKDATTRNKRSVWTIPSQAYSAAHFATFPEALVEPMVLAGTSAHGHCPECGKGWVRVTEQGFTAHDGETASLYETGSTANRLAKLRQAARERGEEYSSAKKTLGWQPSCDHNLAPVPGVVLDPFLGSGTTARVAQSLGRNWLGIELNPDYGKFQDGRITQKGFAFS